MPPIGDPLHLPDALAPAPRQLTGTKLIHYGPAWDAALEATRATPEGPVAVLVFHGMGQQVRYDTISLVAKAILDEAEKLNPQPDAVSPPQVHVCEDSDGFLARAEIQWTDSAQQEHNVHVYEAYWAPLTEGKVTYWETVKFLLLAAWNGLRFSCPCGPRTFKRWMFDEKKTMRIGPYTFLGLIVVLGFLLAQVAIISFVFFELAQQYKAVIARPLPVHATLPFWRAAGQILLDWLRWLGPFVPGHVVLFNPKAFGHHWWWEPLRLLAWFGLVAEAFIVRYFIIEFVGDVAAYISPYKDSKFDELRQKIQDVGLNVGRVIYGFGTQQAAESGAPGKKSHEAQTLVPDYKRVVIVGHSLGSVLAYDTLNALINLDNVTPGKPRNVAGRTRALVTFGSPLDKTAFIFRMRPHGKQQWIREQLAASIQPLIISYALYRPKGFEWVNIWSHWDIISGELNYYDDPGFPPNHAPCVQNMPDPHANFPLYAHLQYWKNEALRKQLYGFVV
ncbi:MAG: hypothetical protein ACLQMT_06030 [Candidatus Acidiferrales bacterium]